MRRLHISLAAVLLLGSCGYRLSGRRFNNGVGQTIAVPTFTNATANYRIEQRVTEAVRRELVQRTRFDVKTTAAGDLVVAGEVRSFSEVPILFDQQGRAASYSISVDLKVAVTDSKSGQVVFRNDQWVFREVFELGKTSQGFVLEDSPAIDRLAKRVASSLVASLLQTTP